MPAQTIICLTVFVITLILYMSNKFPLPLVSMTDGHGRVRDHRMPGPGGCP